MRNFLIKTCFFFVLVAILDFSFGLFMIYAVNRIESGGQGRDNYICNKSTEDILIFGSSRAVHHYNATMLEDSLGLSCYNCGEDGNGIILSYARATMAIERHRPSIVIHDVATDFDILKDDNHKYLGWLKARYDRQGVAEIFEDIDKTEKYKMISQMYRYNSKFFQNLIVYFTSISTETGVKGYRPLKGSMNRMKINLRQDPISYEYDSLKLRYIDKFIELAKGTQLVFVVSPIWYGADSSVVAPIHEICKKKSIPFFDFSNHKKYVHNNHFFKDGTHLNAHGADEFTRDLIKELRKCSIQ